jgi:hypothetical protein
VRWSFGGRWRIRRGGTDGDVAFDGAGEKAVRVARESDNPLQVDGVHVRRMLMMTNPVCSCERVVVTSFQMRNVNEIRQLARSSRAM